MIDPVIAARFREDANARSRAHRARKIETHGAEAVRRHETDRSWVRRLRLLGLTPEDYDRMLAEQGGRCATCGTDKPWSRSGRFPVDHDHDTGHVRGLLCHPCNQALGLLKDDPDTLAAMVEYLRRSRP